MLSKASLAILACLVTSPHSVLAAETRISPCIDISVPRDQFIARDGSWVELTSDQWQFLRGVYAMNPETPPGLPYGDKAVLARVKGNADGLVFFIDGDNACTPMWAPSELLVLMQEVATGAVSHLGAGL